MKPAMAVILSCLGVMGCAPRGPHVTQLELKDTEVAVQKVFYAIRPELRGSNLDLCVYGMDGPDKGEYIDMNGTFNGPTGSNGQYEFYQLNFRVHNGMPLPPSLFWGIRRERPGRPTFLLLQKEMEVPTNVVLPRLEFPNNKNSERPAPTP